MQSPEFPRYAWVEPRSYTKSRKANQPSVIFIHTTEGSEGRSSAEDGAAYDARRTDGTSTHFFVDQDTTVQCVRTTDEAHAARAHGNDVGIQIEVCGRAGQSSAQWKDAASSGAIEQAAELCVAIRQRYGRGRYPLINLTPAQLRAGMHGFAEHKDATLAWPEDGGTHSDPGPNFPWTTLFARIKAIEDEKDMTIMAVTLNAETLAAIAKANWDHQLNINVSGVGPANMQPAGGIQRYLSSQHKQTQAQVTAMQKDVDAIETQIAALEGHLQYLRGEIDKVNADPASGESTIVAAVEYVNAQS